MEYVAYCWHNYFSLIANYYWKYLDQLLYFLLQYHAPKGGFEIFCVEKPKTKVNTNHMQCRSPLIYEMIRVSDIIQTGPHILVDNLSIKILSRTADIVYVYIFTTSSLKTIIIRFQQMWTNPNRALHRQRWSAWRQRTWTLPMPPTWSTRVLLLRLAALGLVPTPLTPR